MKALHIVLFVVHILSVKCSDYLIKYQFGELPFPQKEHRIFTEDIKNPHKEYAFVCHYFTRPENSRKTKTRHFFNSNIGTFLAGSDKKLID